MVAAGAFVCGLQAQQSAPSTAQHRLLVDQYCTSCHNENLRTANLALDLVGAKPVEENTSIWEQVVRSIRMPSETCSLST